MHSVFYVCSCFFGCAIRQIFALIISRKKTELLMYVLYGWNEECKKKGKKGKEAPLGNVLCFILIFWMSGKKKSEESRKLYFVVLQLCK